LVTKIDSIPEAIYIEGSQFFCYFTKQRACNDVRIRQ